MSTFQFRLLAACCWLLALGLLLPVLAAYEDYTLFRDGSRVSAVVTDARVRGDHVSATLAYVDHGTDQTWLIQSTDTAGFGVGTKVDLLLHENNREPILARDLNDQLPTSWLVLGIMAAIALGIFVWRAPTRAAARRATQRGPIDALVAAAARTRNLSAVVGIGLVPISVLFAVIPLFDTGGGIGGSVFLWALAAVSFASAIFVLRRAYRLRDPRNNELVDLIVRRPHEIAWFYLHEIHVRLGGTTLHAHVWKTDGKLASIALVHEDADTVLSEIARRAPHARSGYDPEIEREYRKSPVRWMPGTLAAIALASITLAGCKKDLEEKMQPSMQHVLDQHGERLAPALKMLPATMTEQKCAGTLPAIKGDVPLVSREIADKLAQKSVKALSLSFREPPFFTGSYYTLLTGGWLRSQQGFEDAMRAVEDATVVGIVVTTTYTPPKVSGRDIEAYPHFDGWFVLLDLTTPRVLARVPVSAGTDDMFMVSSDRAVAPQILENLEGNITDAADAALETACPTLVLSENRAKSRAEAKATKQKEAAEEAARTKASEDELAAKFARMDAEAEAEAKAREAENARVMSELDKGFADANKKAK